MPLSEFHPATRSKLESSESKTPNFSPDLPSAMAEGDLVELLWDNGQIVMQGQSSRPKKGPLSSTFPSHSSRIPEKDDMAQRITQYVTGMDSPQGDSMQSTIPGAVTLDAQEDEMSPWFNSSLDDYYYEFLSELSGVHANSVRSHGSNLTLIDKDAPTDAVGPSQVIRVSNDVEPHVPRFPAVTSLGDVGKARTVQPNPHVHERQNSTQLSKPRQLELRGPGSSLVSGHNPSWEFPNTKDQRQDARSPKPPTPPTPSTTTGVINFSHFSRVTSLLKANTQNGNRLRGNKTSYTVVNNPLDSIVINSHNGPKCTVQENLGPISYKDEHKSAAQPLQPFTSSTSQSEAVNWRDEMGNAMAVASVNNGNRVLPDLHIQKMGSEEMPVPPSIAKHDVGKVPEPVMALSSVCSGNGDATESSEPVYRAKRKGTEEESDYQSEDIDDESMGAKKPSGTSAVTMKRSRAAEVHNLSERRRRDRINEKMRALQELIPNCNKVDKASMLDEAIEYLKTLQLQVQIMSMSSGFCMPPMMFPPAMQRMHPPHMAHFPPMGVGVRMGMGVGYGMGMVDINGNPLIPIQPIPNPQFPYSYMGSTGLHSIPPSTSSGLPLFGVPSQGVAHPMHCAPAFVPVTAHSAWPRGSPEVTSLVGGPFHSEMLEPASSRDRHAQIIGSETRQRPEDPQVTQSAQPTKDIDEPSSSAPTNEQVSNVEEAANSSIGNGSSSSGASFDNGTGRA